LKHEDCGPGKRCAEEQCFNCNDFQGCGCDFGVCSDGKGGCETPKQTCDRISNTDHGNLRVGFEDGKTIYYCDLSIGRTQNLIPISKKGQSRIKCPITIW
jgi:hypothetical protein